ncbi:hypothetical protein [Paenibacillus sp. FSL H3-0333]|uniref:hypothetical protein n=1 Tax=Paenibacillus sp. FSL H3-0333 TaxID=2921373 RepID=UPI0030FBABE8
MDTKFYTMTYTLNSGIKNTINLSPVQIDEWLKCYEKDERFITTIGREYFGLNPGLVADFKVHNILSVQRIEIEPVRQTILVNKELVNAYEQGKVRIIAKVDCKNCNTIYTTQLDYKMPRTTCTKCRSEVYLNKEKGIISTGRGDGYFYSSEK